MWSKVVVIWVSILAIVGHARRISFDAIGGKAGDESLGTVLANGKLLNETLNALEPGDVFVFPKDLTFTTMGGIVVNNISDVVIQIDGTLKFSDYVGEWPRRSQVEGALVNSKGTGRALECIEFVYVENVTFTSTSHRGILDGNGNKWWWLPGLGYLVHEEDRPRLLTVTDSKDILVENLLFLDSPYWTTIFRRVDGLVIRHSDISARRTKRDGHALLDLTAFNTDGFDFTGRNIHVHDVQVYSQDDCIAVKDGTENVLVERVNASGVGLTIGSIGSSVVRNVTFRDSVLHNSHKGIYLKFRNTRGGFGSVSDITYENIIIDNNEQWPIWIGPAQQSDTRDLCYANPCSICWPTLPGAECFGMPNTAYSNLMFRNIEIRNPLGSPGVILADPAFPIKNLTFDNVRVTKCRDDTTTFEETFPDLPTDIYDPYITYMALIFVAGFFLLVALPCGICFWKGCCTKVYWQTHPRTKICVIVFVVALLIFLIMTAGWFIHVQSGVGNTDAYYKCEGVESGVALGNTWPVPPCFEDRTTASVAAEDCVNVVAIVLGTLFGSIALGALALLVLRKRSPEKYKSLKRSLPCIRTTARTQDEELT